MPTNKNALVRYQILDELLSNRYRPLPTRGLLREMNNRLHDMGLPEVDLRCVQKDLKFLRESSWDIDIVKVPVEWSDGKSDEPTIALGLCYADASQSIFKKPLKDEEKYLLAQVFSMLGSFDGLPTLEGLDALRNSLNISAEKEIISLEKNPIEHTSLLGELYIAISQETTIRIHYHKFDNPDEYRSRVVYPYLLKEYNRRWYVVASDAEDGKLLSFALDRIDKIEYLSIPYKPYDGDIKERYEEIIGVSFYEEKPLENILFWVSDFSKEYVKTKPLHESQRFYKNDVELRKGYPQLRGGAFFSIECRENYELIRELGQFGGDLLVLSPASIRDKVIERARQMLENYTCLRT